MAPKTPRKLMELCHDALAEGVLAAHDGKLPASWIDMFKANPAAWQQLTDAVTAAPYSHEADRPFGPESIVHIVVSYLEENNGGWHAEWERPWTTMRAVRADALPEWF